jgi:hypothetical protein
VCVYILHCAVNGNVVVFQISIYRDLVVQGNSRDTTCRSRDGISELSKKPMASRWGNLAISFLFRRIVCLLNAH